MVVTDMIKKATKSKAKPQTKPRFGKPVWITAIIVGVAVLIGGVFWWLQADWSQHLDHQTETSQAVQQSAKAVLDAEELSVETLETTEATLRSVADTSCDLDWWQTWRQNLSDEADQTKAACQTLQNDSLESAEAISKLTDRLKYEQQLSQIVSDNVAAIAKLKPDQYDEAKSAWTDTAKSLRDLTVDDSLKGQTDQLVKQAETIAKAYDNLKKANAEQKRPGYDDAVVDLQRAYQAFNGSHSKITESYRGLAVEAVESLQNIR